MKSSFRIFVIFIVFLISSTGNYVLGQTPDSALWESSSKYVFSNIGYNQQTADFTITVFDENGNPLPENVPIAISIDKGIIKGSSLFKTEHNDSVDVVYNGGGVFYFYTNSEGKIPIEYFPYFTPQPFSDLKKQLEFSFPDSSEAFYWKKYDEQFVLKSNNNGALVLEVEFSDPNDESTAELKDFIHLKTESVLPVLIGPDIVEISTTSKHNDQFIFGADGVQPETASLQFTFFDSKGNFLPSGTPVTVDLNYGSIHTNNLLQSPESDSKPYDDIGGGEYIFTIQSQGSADVTYIPPQMVVPGFTSWYQNTIVSTWYTEEEAWEFYKMAEWEIPEGWSGHGYGAIENTYTVSGKDVVSDEFYSGNFISIDSSKSTLPVLVGSDKVTFRTTSKQGDEYVFTSALAAETAEVSISVEDSRGQFVPAGTPITLIVDQLPGIGKITGEGVFFARSSINNQTEIIEDGISVFLRLGELGNSTITYHAPYVNVRPQSVFSNPNRTYDEAYRGIGMFALPANYGCDIPCQNPEAPPTWFDRLSQDNAAIIQPTNISEVPVLIGAEEATVTLKPSYLGAGKIHSKIEATIKDFRGIPVPANTNVLLSTSNGNLPNSSSILRQTIGDEGKVFGQYLSNSRPIDQSPVTVPIVVSVPINPPTDFDSWTIGQGSLTTEDRALNTNTYRVGQVLLGFSLSDALSDLNPLKAYSSMKNFSNSANNVGLKYRTLLNKVADGNATLEDYDAYEQSWTGLSDSFIQLIQDVPGTSITGPSLNGGQIFTSVINNGVRKAIINTTRQELVENQIQRAALNYIDRKIGGSGLSFKQTSVAPFINAEDDPFFGNPDLVVNSDLYTLPSSTGLYELHGIQFKLLNSDSLINMGLFQEGDQSPVFEDILPSNLSTFGLDSNAVSSKGFIEITDLNTSVGFMSGVVIIISHRDTDIIQEFPVDKKIGSSADTLEWLDGSQIIFADSTVLDSTDFFFGSAGTPHPYISESSISMKDSYVIGSFKSDSSIQKVEFIKPGTMKIANADLATGFQPYLYDHENTTWTPLSNFSATNDTVDIEITQTGIIGFGRMIEAVNEPPFLTSLKDTTVEKGASVVNTIIVSDKENDPLNISASSDTSAAQTSLNGNELTTTLDESFIGDALITIEVSDGKNISSTSFRITVNAVNQPPVVSAISDTTISSDEVLIRNIEVSDPDDDSLTLSGTADTTAIQISFDGNILSISPDEGFNGQSLITITVSDGELESSESFILTVNKATSTENITDLPNKVELSQNYPNPFNPSTTIAYGLPETGDVTLEVFDILGRKVATLLEGELKSAGRYTINFNASNLASGMYIYRLQAGNSVLIKKLTLIK